MTNTLQKKLYENGYSIVKNILDYRRDLKPVLNDMEFVMDCLIQKYAKKTEVKKILNLDFKRKYSYISKLNIYDLDQYFNTRLPRDHVKRDSDYFATQSLWNLITNKRILDVVEKILGKEIMSNPVQNTRIKQPEKKLPRSFFLTLSSFVIYVVISKTLDFFLAISALSIFVSYCWGEKRIFYLLLVGIIFPVIVFIFFETILGLRFPPGIITNIYYS